VTRIRPRIRVIADELIDEIVRSPGPVDLMAAFAYPFPIRVVSEILGIPDIDQGYVKALVDPVISATGAAAGDRESAQAELFEYTGRLIAAKRADLSDDLASALIMARDDGDRLDDFELSVSVISLVVAGYENVAKQIGRGMLTLLSHPDQLALLREDPDKIPGAVEEMLRHASLEGGFGPPRFALEDVEIDGFTIPKGTSLVVLKQSANRDEARFDDPERFDIGRESAHHHLTFGAGPHYCVGAPLARAELQIAFARLLERFPRLRLAVPAGDVPWDIRFFGSGPSTLPVVW
jgi:cytochrome P450